jgi:hypothetical protein
MRNTLTHWLSRRPAVPAWGTLQSAFRARGWAPKLTHERDGFALDAGTDGRTWRLEWGPSQREYLGSHELRLRGETGLDPAMHALVMPRAQMAALEHAVYSQFVEGVQTRLDDQTPEEMRWLAMSERLSMTAMGPLHPQFAALGNDTDWLLAWLGGAFGPALAQWTLAANTGEAPATETAQALILRRGQLVWRIGMARPLAETVIAAVAVFELALVEAERQLSQKRPDDG